MTFYYSNRLHDYTYIFFWSNLHYRVSQSALHAAKPFSKALPCSLPSAETAQRRTALPLVPSPVGAIVHIPVVTLECETGSQGDGSDFDRLPLLTRGLTDCPSCFQSVQMVCCQGWRSAPEASGIPVA